MITAKIKKAVTDAISTENKATRKWQDAGIACRAEYASPEALEAVRGEFLDEVIYPAMGDDAVRVINAEVPRKGSKQYNAEPSQHAAWAELQKAKVTVRGKGSVYFGRVLEYAFPEADSDSEGEGSEGEGSEEAAAKAKAAKSPRGRLAAKIGEAQTMTQKQEALTDHDKVLLAAFAAWQTAEAAAIK